MQLKIQIEALLVFVFNSRIFIGIGAYSQNLSLLRAFEFTSIFVNAYSPIVSTNLLYC